MYCKSMSLRRCRKCPFFVILTILGWKPPQFECDEYVYVKIYSYECCDPDPSNPMRGRREVEKIKYWWPKRG